jgi:DNA-binding transcriptional LysR family regulator
MDRFEAMRLFVSVGEAGSLSAAARRQRIPLPTLSRKLAQLEAHLGVRLVTRTTRRFVLTEAGLRYLDSCRRLLTEVDEAERMAAGEYEAPRGRLLVTAPIVFGRLHVLPIALDFLKTYPEVDLRLSLADRIVDLGEENLDVGVRIGNLPSSALIATRVGAVKHITCAAPEYLKAHPTPRAPADLARLDCIGSTNLAPPDQWTYRDKGQDLSVAVRARLTVTTAEAAIDAALAGIGITRLLSYQAAEAIRAGKLQRILRAFEPPELPVHLVHSEARLVPPKLRAFLDFAAPRLRKRLSALPA